MKYSTIFDSNKFRIYVPYRNIIDLEFCLNDHNIEYWIDFEMSNSISDLIRIYFYKKDAKNVEQILETLKIQATDDFFVPSDYKQNQKIIKLYFAFFGTLLGIAFIIFCIYKIS